MKPLGDIRKKKNRLSKKFALTRLSVTNHPNLFQTLDMVKFIEFTRNLFNASTGRPVTCTSQLLAINNGRSIAQL